LQLFFTEPMKMVFVFRWDVKKMLKNLGQVLGKGVLAGWSFSIIIFATKSS